MKMRSKQKGDSEEKKDSKQKQARGLKKQRRIPKLKRQQKRQEKRQKKQQSGPAQATRTKLWRPGKKSPRVTAFDICSRGIKTVTMQWQDEPLLLDCREIFVAADQVFFKSEIDQLLGRVAAWPQADYLIAGIAGEPVMVRDLQVPELPEKELAAAVKFQAEELMLLKSAEMVLEYRVLSREKTVAAKDLHILMAAAPREFSYQISGAFRSRGLQLHSLDLLVLAAGRCVLHFQPELQEQTAAIIDIGASLTHLTVYGKGSIKYVKTLNCGGDSLTRTMAEQLLLSPEEAEQYKMQLTASDVIMPDSWQAAAAVQDIWAHIFEQGWAGVVLQSLKTYGEHYPDWPLDSIVLTGGGSNMAGLPSYLETASGIKTACARCRVPVADTLQDFLLTPEGCLQPQWTAAVGLAVSTMDGGG